MTSMASIPKRGYSQIKKESIKIKQVHVTKWKNQVDTAHTLSIRLDRSIYRFFFFEY